MIGDVDRAWRELASDAVAVSSAWRTISSDRLRADEPAQLDAWERATLDTLCGELGVEGEELRERLYVRVARWRDRSGGPGAERSAARAAW